MYTLKTWLVRNNDEETLTSSQEFFYSSFVTTINEALVFIKLSIGKEHGVVRIFDKDGINILFKAKF